MTLLDAGPAAATAGPGPDATGRFPLGPLAEADARFCPHCYRHGPTVTCDVQAHWPEPRPGRPLYLSGVHCAATDQLEASGADIGLILQPGSHLEAPAVSLPV